MHDEFDHHEHALSAELAALEQQLAALVPVALQVDRDRLMFAAGAASVDDRPGRPRYIAEPSWLGRPWLGRRFWQSTTALATAASLMLAATLAWEGAEQDAAPPPTFVDRAHVSPAPFERRQLSDRLPPGYLGLRQVALAHGVGQMEPTRSSASDAESIDVSPPTTSRQLLQELLHAEERTNS